MANERKIILVIPEGDAKIIYEWLKIQDDNDTKLIIDKYSLFLDVYKTDKSLFWLCKQLERELKGAPC